MACLSVRNKYPWLGEEGVFFDPFVWSRHPIYPLPAAYVAQGIYGMWDPQQQCIWLAPSLTPAQERTTLTHELLHALRNDEQCATNALTRKQEILVEDLTAELLIPLPMLEPHLAPHEPLHHQVRRIAEEFNVDEPLVWHRLTRLSRAETANHLRQMT